MGPSFTAMDVDAEPCLPEGSTAGLRGRLAPWLALAVLFVVAVALRNVLPANTDVSWLRGIRYMARSMEEKGQGNR